MSNRAFRQLAVLLGVVLFAGAVAMLWLPGLAAVGLALAIGATVFLEGDET